MDVVSLCLKVATLRFDWLGHNENLFVFCVFLLKIYIWLLS